jgi:hypothetical protein
LRCLTADVLGGSDNLSLDTLFTAASAAAVSAGPFLRGGGDGSRSPMVITDPF